MSINAANLNSDANKPVIRIDGAHRIAAAAGGVKSEAPNRVVASVGEASGESAEQIQLQAGQLARHLQDRRRDVDHREAQTNARIAQLENELRLSRLWLREQNQEFTQREVELRQQLSDHESRVTSIAATELELDKSRRQFSQETHTREDLVARREIQVTESQQRIAHEAARLQSLRERLELDRQQQEQEQADHQFRSHQFNEWQRERVELQQQVHQRQRELESEREVLTLQSRRWLEERDQQQQTLQRERKHLDQRQATLERVRAEVLRLHREALEMRLVAEQLWAQLAGRATPAEMTAGVSKLHHQLADEFRFASQDMETQRSSLRELIGRLEQKQQELTVQRTELVDWFRRRQADLAQKSVELSQRDQHLNTERQKFRDQQQQWKSERRQLQQHVHQLEALHRHQGIQTELATGAVK